VKKLIVVLFILFYYSIVMAAGPPAIPPPCRAPIPYNAESWQAQYANCYAPATAVAAKIETLAGGHDAVTLAASLTDIFGISAGQELSADVQVANYVLAGPTSGAAAAPTFRALVADDIPDLSGTYEPAGITESDISDLGAYLTAETDPTALLTAGTDNVKDTHVDWGSGAGQVNLADIPGGTAPANAFDFASATWRLPAANADPTATAGYLVHDTTVTNHAHGAVRWHDGTNIRQAVDMVAATAEGCTDDQVVAYDADADLFYCKAEAAGAGDFLADGSVAMTGAPVPNAANTIALGSATVEWADVFFGDGAVISGQNDQSATLTSSASLWTANNFAVDTQFKLPSSNADVTATAGYTRHDSTVTNFTGGALRYYNGAATKQLLDMTAATAEGCTDDYVVAYDADADLWYCKADGGAGAFTAAVTTAITPTTPIVLDEATGDEKALNLSYTTNKATSGADYGLYINQTDTSSPGTSYLIWSGKDGTSRFNVSNAGDSVISGGLTTAGFVGPLIKHGSNNSTLAINGTNTYNNTDNGVEFFGGSGHTLTQGTGETFNGVAILPIYNQTDTAGANDLFINRTETAIGTGEHNIVNLQVGGTPQLRITNKSHIVSSGADPAVSSCGTSPTITGSDTSGIVTVGGGGAVTACTVTFASAFTAEPSCIVIPQANVTSYLSASSTSAITVTFSGDIQSGKFNYLCVGL